MTQARRTPPDPTPREDAEVDRDALTEALERKLRRLGTRKLIRIAADLNVALPTARGRPGRPAPAAATPTLRGEGMGQVVTAREGLKALDKITVDEETLDWADSELLGAVQLAERLKVSRATIDNWRTTGRILGFQKGVRNYLFPLRQFERMKPVEGLRAVAHHFEAEEDAWDWLVTPNVLTDGEPPIEQLRKKRIDLVVAAAEGALDYV